MAFRTRVAFGVSLLVGVVAACSGDGAGDRNDDSGSGGEGKNTSGGRTGSSGGDKGATGGGNSASGGNPASAGAGGEMGGFGGATPGLGGSALERTCWEIETFENVAPTRELFVDGSVSESGDGSEAQPYSTIEEALDAATPGTAVRIQEGTYEGDIFVSDLRGTAEAPIWIGARNTGSYRPILEGGGTAIQLSGASHIIVHDLIITGQEDNGINIDDGEVSGGTHHIIVRNVEISNVGNGGNQDCLKLSGVDDFFVLDSRFSFCSAGSAIDQVGCHHGVIARNTISDLEASGVQAKGGSEDILVSRNSFVEAGQRPINMGGSTDFAYFRPALSDDHPNFEARDIRVIANHITGGTTAVAFVGCVDCLVANNTIADPERWVVRILQETTSSGGYEFLPASNGRFVNNIVSAETALSADVNTGPDTSPETFEFSNNLWFFGGSSDREPSLPVAETDGIYGADPTISDAQGNITSASPAAGAGLELSALHGDLLGYCYAMPPSIGARELHSRR